MSFINTYSTLRTTPELMRTTANILRVAMDESNVIVLRYIYIIYINKTIKNNLYIK